MSKIGDIIEKGQDIPADVIGVRDRDGDEVVLNSIGHWHAPGFDDPGTCVDDPAACGVSPMAYAPLTVTAVREPERKVERAGWPDQRPEPQEADASVPDVLEMIQHYGHLGFEGGVAAGQRDEAGDDHYDGQARRLYDQIATAVQRLSENDATGDLQAQRDEALAEIERLGGEVNHYRNAAQDLRRMLDETRADRDRIVALGDHLRDQLRAERDEALAEVVRLNAEAERVTDALVKARDEAAAQPDPSVLSLPQAQPSSKTGGRVHLATIKLAELRGLLNQPLLNLEPGVAMRTLRDAQELLFEELKEPVVMREPRTWPKLDGAPESLRRVEVRQRDGRQFTATRRVDDRWAADIASNGNAEALESFECYTWSELLGEGDVTEVFE